MEEFTAKTMHTDGSQMKYPFVLAIATKGLKSLGLDYLRGRFQ